MCKLVPLPWCYLCVALAVMGLPPATSGRDAPCSLITCPNTSSTVFLSIAEKNDGFGAEMMYYLSALAYAHERGWNFGGVYAAGDALQPMSRSKQVHNVTVVAVLDAIFGHSFVLPEYKAKAAAGGRLKTVTVDGGVAALEQMHAAAGHTNLFVPSVDLQFLWLQKHRPWPPGFLDGIRCDARAGMAGEMRRLGPPRGPLSVVAHMRLGDVAPLRDDCAHRRTVCKQIYLTVLSAIRRQFPAANIVVQSSTVDPGSEADFALQTEFRGHGFELILDNEMNRTEATFDLIRAFARMASADVLVSSRSSLPRVAGLFNPGCEIALRPRAQEQADGRIHYVPYNTTTSDLMAALNDCLQRRRSRCPSLSDSWDGVS